MSAMAVCVPLLRGLAEDTRVFQRHASSSMLETSTSLGYKVLSKHGLTQ